MPKCLVCGKFFISGQVKISVEDGQIHDGKCQRQYIPPEPPAPPEPPVKAKGNEKKTKKVIEVVESDSEDESDNTIVTFDEKKHKNVAFILIKPHANTPRVQSMIRDMLKDCGVDLLAEGPVNLSPQNNNNNNSSSSSSNKQSEKNNDDSQMSITESSKNLENSDEQKNDKPIEKVVMLSLNDMLDKQFISMSSKALFLKPIELKVPNFKFQREFKMTWEEALVKELVYNAQDAMTYLRITPSELNSLWSRSIKIYCKGDLTIGKIKVPDKPAIFVINGFYPEMKAQYTKPEASVYFFTVGFNDSQLTWTDFNRNIIGDDNPKEAGHFTLRGQLYLNWREYGLQTRPDLIDNGIHASYSPFEALLSRMNWLHISADTDEYYGKKLLASGFSMQQIEEFSLNPPVVDEETLAKIQQGSTNADMVYLFDKLRDMDWDECLKTLHFYLTCFEYVPETVITSIELEKKIEKEQRRIREEQELMEIEEASKNPPLPPSPPQGQVKNGMSMQSVSSLNSSSKSKNSNDEISPRGVDQITHFNIQTTNTGGHRDSTNIQVSVRVMNKIPKARSKSQYKPGDKHLLEDLVDGNEVKKRNNDYFSRMIVEEKEKKEAIEKAMDTEDLIKYKQAEEDRKLHESKKLLHYSQLGKVFVQQSSTQKTQQSTMITHGKVTQSTQETTSTTTATNFGVGVNQQQQIKKEVTHKKNFFSTFF